MSFAGIFTKYSRMLFNPIQQYTTRNLFTDVNPLAFRMTDILLGEPLKKKKRLDPQVIRRREDRKLKKITKAIRRLEKHARKLKPIDECEIPFKLIDEKEKRTRPPPNLSNEVIDRRALLQKEWANYKRIQSISDMNTINSMIESQQKALDELRNESEELYQAAIKLDISSMLPCVSEGPGVLYTTPIPKYFTPDGEYTDITKRYEGQDELEERLKKQREDNVANVQSA
ncbi:39S ribosomal protein L40, mitochondrial [Chelonus insularis]|uniref:39S ribosomal protein L40, mitochondrial n=1 Tax=Chelonus insularis TaxID=460826 RepID=UPI001589959A|nr:39S ribosomal protein L40, mitochondrial [Chelonus insularis]